MVLDTPAKRLKWAREQHGKYRTASEAAKAFGWVVSTYLGHENDDRNPSRQAAKRYARAYHVRWEWLLEGEGAPATKQRNVQLVGFIGSGSEINFYPQPKILDNVELPPGVSISTVAIEVRGGSMRGIADDGWLIFFDHVKSPPTAELVGKLCIVEVDGGRVLIRTLQPGRRKGRYDLESATDATIRDAKVTWAARVTWIKPR